MSHVGLTAADVHHFVPPGVGEAHAMSAAIVPGAEHALVGPMVGAAGEPISPLIQLIMRMPGQIGLLNNFFEALGGFFLPYLHNLLPAAFDPMMVSMHAQASHLAHALNINPHAAATHFRLPGAEHMHVDVSLISHNAPMFHNSSFADSSAFLSSDKFSMSHSELINPRSAMNVNGGLDMNNPQFEGASSLGSVGQRSELLSGPSMSDSPVGTHLAGTQRLFSDRIQGTYFSKQGMGAALASTQGNAAGLSQTVPLGNAPISASQALASNPVNTVAPSMPQSMPASDMGSAANIGNGGAESGVAGNSFVPTLGDKLASGIGDKVASGSQQTVAWNTGSDASAFKPTLGAGGSDYGASYLKSQPSLDTSSPSPGSHVTTGGDHAAPLKGLKAKELTLDGKVAPDTPPAHKAAEAAAHHAPKTAHAAPTQKMDQISHHETPNRVAYDTNEVHHAAAPAPTHHIAPEVKPHQIVKAAAKTAAKQVAHKDVPHHEVAKAAEPQKIAKAPEAPADANSTANGDAANSPTDNTAGSGDAAAGAAGAAPASNYTIRAGDCLWNIAKDKLGSGLKWQEIYNMNKDVLGTNPDLVYSGTAIKLPGAPGADIAGTGAGAGQYVVKSGDCLWNIAKNQMHDATKWSDLYKANTDVIGANPRLIMPGQHLNIPGADHSQMVADSGASAGANAGASAGPAAGGDQTMAGATGSASPTGAPSGDVATYHSAPGAPTDAGAAAQNSMPAAEVQPALQPTAPALHPTAPALQPAAPPALQQQIPTLQTAPGLPSHAALPPAQGAPQLSMGPGAAGAATLHALPLDPSAVPTVADGAAVYQPKLVNNSAGADLAAFLAKKK